MTTSAMEWAVQDVGEDPNDTPSEGGLTDKEQIFIIVTAVLVVTIAFEKIKNLFTEMVAHSGMSEIVEHLFGELTIMGFIGLIIFLLDKLNALDMDLNEKCEQMHMIIFVIAIFFLTEVILLIKLGVNMECKWRRQEESIHADPVQGRIAIIFEYAHAREVYRQSCWSRWNYWNYRWVGPLTRITKERERERERKRESWRCR